MNCEEGGKEGGRIGRVVVIPGAVSLAVPSGGCCSGAIDITQHNLAYVTALYTVNDKMRLELLEGSRTHADNSLREGDLPVPLLLDNPAVTSHQSRLLLLVLVVSCTPRPPHACLLVECLLPPFPLAVGSSSALTGRPQDQHVVQVPQ